MNHILILYCWSVCVPKNSLLFCLFCIVIGNGLSSFAKMKINNYHIQNQKKFPSSQSRLCCSQCSPTRFCRKWDANFFLGSGYSISRFNPSHAFIFFLFSPKRKIKCTCLHVITKNLLIFQLPNNRIKPGPGLYSSGIRHLN